MEGFAADPSNDFSCIATSAEIFISQNNLNRDGGDGGDADGDGGSGDGEGSVESVDEMVSDVCGEGFSRMKCYNYGDPHFTTFSGNHHNAMGQGEYILAQDSVKSFSVHA